MLGRLRAALARAFNRGESDAADGDGATARDDPTAFSLLDRSVQSAHGQATHEPERTIRQIETKADQLEAVDHHRDGPDRPN